MLDKYYGFDTYEEDVISNADYVVDKAMDNPEFMAENFEAFCSAMEVQMAAEKRARMDRIEKRRLNQHYQEKLKRGKIWGLIAGSVFGVSVLLAAPQVQGADVLANQVYTIMNDNGFSWRDDSQAGIIFNKYNVYVDYNTALNTIIDKCEEVGMTSAQIDVALDALLHIKPTNSTLRERVTAKNDAYHESKIVNREMGR